MLLVFNFCFSRIRLAKLKASLFSLDGSRQRKVEQLQLPRQCPPHRFRDLCMNNPLTNGN